MISPEARGAAAGAMDALVAALSARLDALVASWELGIATERASGVAAEGVTPRKPADVLAELERELTDLERHCEEQAEAVDSETRQAVEWEQRAMTSVREGRDDLAREALLRQREHAAAARAAAAETTELEAVRDAYRHAVAAIRTTVARE